MQYRRIKTGLAVIGLALAAMMLVISRAPTVFAQGENPNPPDGVVKLIFIHHSTGENWLQRAALQNCLPGKVPCN